MAVYEVLEDGTLRRVAGSIKDYTAGDGINIENGVISANKQIKLLWTNPSPTSGFSAQTINLSNGDYDLLLIQYAYVKDNNESSHE